MNPTVTRLTPSGTGAIATLELRGPSIWSMLRSSLRKTSGKELPLQLTAGATFLTRVEELGEELVVVVRQAEPLQVVEIHSHGGEQIVRWLIEHFEAQGISEQTFAEPATSLARAETLRVARILLDQSTGIFRKKIESLLEALAQNHWSEIDHALQRLKCLIPAAQHLTKPFQLAIVGAPNVGKSSLMNALVGYQRSVVAHAPGTTRDTVTTRLSLDGWTIDITDTAGLREAFDPLEKEGIERAQNLLKGIDLCLWILDSTTHPIGPTLKLIERVNLSRETLLFVLNKCDRSATWDLRQLPQAVRVAATTGMGLKHLCERIVAQLVPSQPLPGEAVPLQPQTHRLLQEAIDLVHRRDSAGLERILNQLLTSEEGEA